MITYEYECRSCDANFEVQQSIKDDAYTVCPECNQDTLFRVIHPPLHVQIVGEATTIGQLAERNAKKMSREEMDMAHQRFKTKKTINRIPEDRRPESLPAETPKDNPAWLEQPRTKTTKEVTKLSPKATEKYVMTGE
jgi:putative FmdB family regulatory protein